MSAFQLPPISRVAVIGAGSLGLAQVKQLIDGGVDRKDIVVYEARDEVGGIWRFEEDTEDPSIYYTKAGQALVLTPAERADRFKLAPSPMYESLRTNLPHYVMAFRDNPFEENTEIFPPHYRVHSYLKQFAQTHGLESCIRLKTVVQRIFHTPNATSSGERWTVQSETGGQTFQETFSHIVIANGHYNQPYIPYVPGLWKFKGSISHSRSWRSPKDFTGQKILVIGSKSSGGDIVHDLSLYNLSLPASSSPQTTIHLSTRSPDPFPLPLERWTTQVHLVPPISSISSDGSVVFTDGTELAPTEVDAIIFATGYRFDFPFIDQEKDEPWVSAPILQRTREEGLAEGLEFEKVEEGLEKRVGARQVDRLDPVADMFYLPDPTIAFLGLAYMVVPFRLSETQARLLTYVWTRTHSVPLDLPPMDKTDRIEGNRHAVGFPAEWVNADRWLAAIGQGGTVGPGWHQTSEEWKEARRTAKVLRKELYGY